MKKPKIYGLKKNGVYVYIGKTTKYQEDKVSTRVADGPKYRLFSKKTRKNSKF